MSLSTIKDNLEQVNSNIVSACIRSGRKTDSVTLIAVSKTKPVEMLLEAYAAGVRDFGENKVQEIVDKIDKLPPDARFHMIGHLQTNKVKYIIDRIYMIHSLDSVKLAMEIDKRAKAAGRVVPCLIEINIGNEESKYGINPKEAAEFAAEVSQLTGIKIMGLMCVAPAVDDPEDAREYFVRMRELSVDITRKNIDNIELSILSMGMSGDYMVAVEEGANFVRVGSSIFGLRDYSKL
ncbi:MAG: YggS family pyridoxal phosphate-dependent enzyme [Lachnospiraceae bacterium]|nr:YggS family pyridoxal phosphate-dependent enzyme [Lachnospiraceae bacterium]